MKWDMFLFRSRLVALAVFTGLLMIAVPGRASLHNGLLAYWQFEGNGLDSSGNGFDLNLVNTPGFDPGLFGQAISLDHTNWAARPGDDDEFDFGDSDFTFQVWVKFDQPEGVRTGGIVLDKFNPTNGPGWTVIAGDRNEDVAIFFPGHGGEYYSTGVISPTFPGLRTGDVIVRDPTTWHQIVVTGDSANITLFVDGNPLATSGGRETVTDSSEPLYIGRRTVTDIRGNSEVYGDFDEVAIWNRALSPGEITTLWNGGQGTAVPEPGTIALLGLGGLGLLACSRRRRK